MTADADFTYRSAVCSSRVSDHQPQVHADIAEQQCDRSRGVQRGKIRRGMEKTKLKKCKFDREIDELIYVDQLNTIHVEGACEAQTFNQRSSIPELVFNSQATYLAVIQM